MQANAPEPPEEDRLTPEQESERKRRQRSRSLALAGVLVVLAILFYIVTIIQLSNNIGASPQ